MPTGRVLVVDDDFDIREATAEVLADHGFQVSTAENGRDALEKLEGVDDGPCLILLDLMMPIMDAWEFRRHQLREPRLATIPVVVISAHPDAQKNAASLGAVGCIDKPMKLDTLVGLAQRFCGRAPPA